MYLIFENKEICQYEITYIYPDCCFVNCIAGICSHGMGRHYRLRHATKTPAPAAAEPADSAVVSRITIDGQTIEVTYGQVKDKVKVLPPQLQNAPFNEFFPILQKSIETEQIIMYLANKAKVTDNPEYQKMVKECQKGVMQKLFLDMAVAKRATEEEYRKVYDEYKKSAPKEDEIDLSIITVTDKAKAAKLLKDAKAAGPAGFAHLPIQNL